MTHYQENIRPLLIVRLIKPQPSHQGGELNVVVLQWYSGSVSVSNTEGSQVESCWIQKQFFGWVVLFSDSIDPCGAVQAIIKGFTEMKTNII